MTRTERSKRNVWVAAILAISTTWVCAYAAAAKLDDAPGIAGTAGRLVAFVAISVTMLVLYRARSITRS